MTNKLDDMLKTAGISKKSSYHPGEVCQILGISYATFWRKTEKWEADPRTGLPSHPDALDSIMLGSNKRVTYEELAAFVARNRTWHRRNAVDPRQLPLFQ